MGRPRLSLRIVTSSSAYKSRGHLVRWTLTIQFCPFPKLLITLCQVTNPPRLPFFQITDENFPNQRWSSRASSIIMPSHASNPKSWSLSHPLRISDPWHPNLFLLTIPRLSNLVSHKRTSNNWTENWLNDILHWRCFFRLMNCRTLEWDWPWIWDSSSAGNISPTAKSKEWRWRSINCEIINGGFSENCELVFSQYDSLHQYRLLK
jgi:hypothetical protein